MDVKTDLIPAREIINIELTETELLDAIVDYLVAQGGNLGTKIERIRNDTDFHIELPGTSFAFEVRIENTFLPELPGATSWGFPMAPPAPRTLPGMAAWGGSMPGLQLPGVAQLPPEAPSMPPPPLMAPPMPGMPAAAPAVRWYRFDGPTGLVPYWGEGVDANSAMADARFREEDFPSYPNPPTFDRQPTANEIEFIPKLVYRFLVEGAGELQTIARTEYEARLFIWSQLDPSARSRNYEKGSAAFKLVHRGRVQIAPSAPVVPMVPGMPAAVQQPMAPPAVPKFYLVEGTGSGLIKDRKWLRADSDEQAIERFRNGFTHVAPPPASLCKVLDRKVERTPDMYVINLDRAPS